ncbi:MAG: cytochrome c3 family protein [Planctomycetota bacterium]
MHMLASMVLLWAVAAPPGPLMRQAAGEASPSSCAVCHGQQGREVGQGAHARAGIGCVDCHGGVEGPLDVEPAHAGKLRALTDRRTTIAVCGGCHANVEQMRGFGLRTDQASLYAQSQHGKKLAEDALAEVATCVTCHGAHQVLPVSDSRSPVHKTRQVETCGRCHGDEQFATRYGMRHDMIEGYRRSVHGRALLEEGRISSPACTDCHGSHGAAPPRFADVGLVCGQCHSVVQRYFEQSPHHTAARRGEIEECVACHRNHAVAEPRAEMLLVRDGSVCSPCHGDADDKARTTAATIYNDLQKLDRSIAATDQMLHDAAARGLFIDEEAGYLDDARSLRIRARAITHTLSTAALADVLNRGQAMVEETRERMAVKGRAFRDRKIFTAVFFGVVLMFAALLQVYRREISGRWTRRRRS